MSVALAVSKFLPTTVSGIGFSMRRTNSGCEYFDDNNPVVGAMNFGIASGQIFNAFQNTTAIAKESTIGLAKEIVNVEQGLKALSAADKAVNGIGKVVKTVAGNVNGFIGLTGVAKVLTAKDEDRAEVFAEQAIAIPMMLGFEGATKKIAGMAKVKTVDGRRIAIEREGLYKKIPFLDKQVKALNDYCATKKLFNKVSLKGMPAILQGLLFMTASIYGYKTGAKLSRWVMGKESSES